MRNLKKNRTGSYLKVLKTPMPIDEYNWYYEEKKGVSFVHEVYGWDNGKYLQTDIIFIPWKRLLESVRRKYKM